MPSVDELLLNGIDTLDDVEALEETNKYCEIDETGRVIVLNDLAEILGVENDKEVERVYFRCPRYVGDNVDLDLKQCTVYINFQNANMDKDQYIVTDLNTDERDSTKVTFSWLLSKKVTQYKGIVNFIVCARKTKTGGEIEQEWNTTLARATVLEGLEPDPYVVPSDDLDVVNQLMDLVKQEIEQKGQETMDSIPDDYVTLSDMVESDHAELTDVRLGADGKTYASAGEAVREQNLKTLKRLSKFSYTSGEISYKGEFNWDLLTNILWKSGRSLYFIAKHICNLVGYTEEGTQHILYDHMIPGVLYKITMPDDIVKIGMFNYDPETENTIYYSGSYDEALSSLDLGGSFTYNGPYNYQQIYPLKREFGDSYRLFRLSLGGSKLVSKDHNGAEATVINSAVSGHIYSINMRTDMYSMGVFNNSTDSISNTVEYSSDIDSLIISYIKQETNTKGHRCGTITFRGAYNYELAFVKLFKGEILFVKSTHACNLTGWKTDGSQHILYNHMLPGVLYKIEVPYDITAFGMFNYDPETENTIYYSASYDELLLEYLNTDQYQPTIITLGDSITKLGTTDRGWIKYFIEKTNAELIANVAENSAVLKDYGDTVYDGNPQQSVQSNNVLGNQVQKILNNDYEEPDIIIIAIGTNGGINITDDDMKNAYFDNGIPKELETVDRKTDAGAFRYCSETLHNKYPNAIIFWCSPIAGAYDLRPMTNAIQYSKSLEIATKWGSCVFIDTLRCGITGVNEVNAQNGEYLIDGLHPNANGAKVMGYYNASIIMPYIKGYL